MQANHHASTTSTSSASTAADGSNPPAAPPDRPRRGRTTPAAASLVRLASVGMSAAKAAHELRNVLTPALNHAHLAATRLDDVAYLERALAAVIHSIESAALILDQTLGTSRNAPQTPIAPANVRQVMDNIIMCLRLDREHDAVDIEVDVARDLQVDLPSISLQQILLNLVLNALAALDARRAPERGEDARPCAPTDRGTIRIRAARARPGVILLRVGDNGPGLPEDVAARLTTQSTAAKVGELRAETEPGAGGGRGLGHGLGLTICCELVEAHGGRIAVETTPGKGTTFVLTLPAARRTLAKAG